MTQTSAEQIEMLSMKYEIALQKAVRENGSEKALDYYLEAATAQYELSVVMHGESAERHKREMYRLLYLVRDEIIRMKVKVSPEVMDLMAKLGVEFPGAQAKEPAPSAPRAEKQPAAAETVRTSAKSSEGAKPGAKSAKASGGEEKGEDLHGFDPASVRLQEIPSASFADFGDMDESIKAIVECLTMAYERREYKNLSEQMSDRKQNILLYGPPGGGKTHFCKAIGNYVLNTFEGSAFFLVTAAQIKHSLVGVSEKRLSALFKEVANYEMPVVCIDEIETLCPPRDENVPSHVSSLVTELLQHIDGVNGKSKAVIVGATNYPWKIDKAIRSRLSTDCYVGLPDAQHIADYLKLRLRKYLGKDEAFAEQMIQLCTKRMENASYRVLDWLWLQIETISFKKTTKANPENKEIAEFMGIPSSNIFFNS